MSRLLLVTGAGASRNLGVGKTPMPLMRNWANALCDALDKEESGLAAACHLNRELDGPQFEETLGLLLKWDQLRSLALRFADLGKKDFRSERPGVEQARKLTATRLATIRRSLDSTLYDQFGQRNVDDEKAVAAYGKLLNGLGKPQLVLATTNYDRSADAALEALGHQVDTGFRGGYGRTPRLSPAGLVGNAGSRTPVIHLHGAVGWYEKEGSVEDHYADQPYIPDLGTPVVLYPDPDKDPTGDASVSQLWLEFETAAKTSDAIAVIGHSLHDHSLVQVLKSAAKRIPVVISYMSTGDAKRIKKEIPDAVSTGLEFGPESRVPVRMKRMFA